MNHSKAETCKGGFTKLEMLLGTFPSQKGETYKAVTLEESLTNGAAQQMGVWSLVVAPRVSNFNMCLDVEASSRKHRARPHYPEKFCARFRGCASFASSDH